MFNIEKTVVGCSKTGWLNPGLVVFRIETLLNTVRPESWTLGILLGSSGLEPSATSSPSGNPSRSVSGFSGSVPLAISVAFVRLSASGSPLGSDPGTVRALFGVPGTKLTAGLASELPAALIAIKMNLPDALGSIERARVADVPEESIAAEVTLTFAGDEKEADATLRRTPHPLPHGFADVEHLGVEKNLLAAAEQVVEQAFETGGEDQPQPELEE